MSALAQPAIQPDDTPHESRPDFSVIVPPAAEPSSDVLPLTFMLIACGAFAVSLAAWVVIPAIKTVMGT